MNVAECAMCARLGEITENYAPGSGVGFLSNSIPEVVACFHRGFTLVG